MVSLYNKGKEYRYFVHRLVARLFIPTDDTSLEVIHKNGILDDNRVENLEWGFPLQDKETKIRKRKEYLAKKLKEYGVEYNPDIIKPPPMNSVEYSAEYRKNNKEKISQNYRDYYSTIEGVISF